MADVPSTNEPSCIDVARLETTERNANALALEHAPHSTADTLAQRDHHLHHRRLGVVGAQIHAGMLGRHAKFAQIMVGGQCTAPRTLSVGLMDEGIWHAALCSSPDPMKGVLRLVEAAARHQVADMLQALVATAQVDLADFDDALDIEVLQLILLQRVGRVDGIALLSFDQDVFIELRIEMERDP